jgi:glutamate---cysteine ligase / carboxylate-amine ligase
VGHSPGGRSGPPQARPREVAELSSAPRTVNERGVWGSVGLRAGSEEAAGPPGPELPTLPVRPRGLGRTATGSRLEWRPGGQFTVGAEDELLLVDEDGRLLGAAAAPVVAHLSRRGPRGGVTGEVFVDQVELNTPVCADAESLATSLGRLRQWLTGNGARPMAAGVHPEAPFGAACMASSRRYDGIVAEFGGLFRTPTAALQVHVAFPDTETAMVAYRGLRNRLSLLRALSASSPFWHGEDSRLASARSAITRSYPRVTVPPALRSWEEYVSTTKRIVAAAGIPDYTYVWWDLRPQPPLGTLEVRVMDTQPSLSRVAGLTALVQGLARHTVEVPDAHDLPDDVLAANDYRACRHGLETAIVDVDGAIRSMRVLAARSLAEARRALAPDGLDRPLDVVESMLLTPSEPQRQRLLCQQHGMSALLADLVARTADVDG